jgi:hypothetical protein
MKSGDSGVTILPIATLIAVLLIALKAGDLMLTAEQQKAVQRYCDDLTLRLEYANIGRLYLIFRRKRWQRRLYISLIVTETMIGTAMPLYSFVTLDIKRMPGEPLLLLILVTFVPTMGLAIWITWLLARRAWGPTARILDWLLGVSERPVDVWWILWAVALIMAVRVPLELTKSALVQLEPAHLKSISPVGLTGPIEIDRLNSRLLAATEANVQALFINVLAGFATIPAQYVAMEVSLLSCLMALVAMTHLLLWFAKGIMWRVASYSKGAWAAVVILVTLLFALADIVLKRG